VLLIPPPPLSLRLPTPPLLLTLLLPPIPPPDPVLAAAVAIAVSGPPSLMPTWLCLSPLSGHARLAVAHARLACGGAAAVGGAAPAGVAHTPALCVVHTHLYLRSFVLALVHARSCL
jgi:hypothetical protein